MGRVGVAILLAITLVFAGCMHNDRFEPERHPPDAMEDPDSDESPGAMEDPGDQDGPDETPVEDDDPQPGPDPGEAPAPWEVGYAWTYETNLGTEITLAVTSDQGDDWFVDTTDPDIAWLHTRSELSYLDQIRKDDIAGSQGDNRVLYYDFPLQDGKKWTTEWGGEKRRIETVEENGTFRFEAYKSMRLAVEYDYDPEIGWFSQIVFYDNQTGAVSLSLELTKHQTDWQGEIVRWDAQMHARSTLSGYGGRNRNFTVEEGTEELWVRQRLECADGGDSASFQLLLTPIPISEQTTFLTETCLDEDEILVIEEPDPTEWTYWIQMYNGDPEKRVRLELETWSRNLVVLDAP